MSDNVYQALLFEHLPDETSVEKLILKYERWFLEGKASPADLLSSGKSFVHVGRAVIRMVSDG
jgi:hypothetical protein